MRFAVLRMFAAAAVIVMSTATVLFAGTPGAPEIDPGTIAAGLGVLAGGALILRARRRSK